ncbi:hypothetical protein AVEN_165959-1 [Araneus ventricosus]|uniref:Uncharacterized protein n=1 Tax=Araneus ventricosus TaxID=182803 RepID=A0A4Y2ND22_ARAVE|nr:hypothetical protein AVEN_165959-1 [Araneus ventricosus]
MKWRGVTPQHSVFRHIYLGVSCTAAPLKQQNNLLQVTLIPYCINSPPLSKRQSPHTPISSERREPHSPPHVFVPSAFQHLWPGSTNGVVGYPDWLEIITSAPRRSNSHRCFCTDDRNWRSAV